LIRSKGAVARGAIGVVENCEDSAPRTGVEWAEEPAEARAERGPVLQAKGRPMTEGGKDLGATWWQKNLDEVDREIARLATICNVKILDPGVIERVLQNDATVCGSKNPLAFEKLRAAVMMHYSVRNKAVGAIGQSATAYIVEDIVERLRKTVGDRLGGTPS
jgi:hypothetical protein